MQPPAQGLPYPPVGRTPGDGRTELPVVAHLAYDLPVVCPGRGRVRLAQLAGPVGVKEVLLRDAHGCSPSRDVETGFRGLRGCPGAPRLRCCGGDVASIDGRRQSAPALSVAGCTMRS